MVCDCGLLVCVYKQVNIVSKKLANECEEIALNLELRNMRNLHSSFPVAVINKCPWTPSQEEL